MMMSKSGAFINLDPVDPGFPARKLFGEGIENDDGITLVRPQNHEAANRTCDVQMPRERAGHRHSTDR
jgi:hypothetical protein